MARFQAFKGVLYEDNSGSGNDGAIDLSDVVVPGDPSNQWNAIHLLDEKTRRNTWQSWFGTVIQQDPEPALYMFRMGRKLADGKAWQGSGVIGLGELESAPSIEPQIIEVDNTEFAHLLIPSGLPLATATALDGTHYRLWALRQHGVIETIADAVGEVTSGLFAATSEHAAPPVGLVFGPPGD